MRFQKTVEVKVEKLQHFIRCDGCSAEVCAGDDPFGFPKGWAAVFHGAGSDIHPPTFCAPCQRRPLSDLLLKESSNG